MNVAVIRYAEDFEVHRIIDVTNKDVKEVIQDCFPNATYNSDGTFTADDPQYDGETLLYSYVVCKVEL